jgi:hypothetical protein
MDSAPDDWHLLAQGLSSNQPAAAPRGEGAHASADWDPNDLLATSAGVQALLDHEELMLSRSSIHVRYSPILFMSHDPSRTEPLCFPLSNVPLVPYHPPCME